VEEPIQFVFVSMVQGVVKVLVQLSCLAFVFS